MKTVDFKEGKFLVTDQEVKEYQEEAELDYDFLDPENHIKLNPLPKEVEVIRSMKGDICLKVDCNGWLKITEAEAITLLYKVESLIGA